MASRFENCVTAASEAGKVSKKHAREVLEAFQDAKARGLSDVEAAAEVSAKSLEGAETLRAATAQQIIKQAAALEASAAHPKGARAGGRAIFVPDPWGMAKNRENVEGQARAMQGWLESKFGVAIGFLKSKTMGLTDDTISARGFVRAHYNEAADAAAVNAAKGWGDVDEFSIKMRQQEGSTVQPIKGYLPQAPNHVKIQRMGHEAYVAARLNDWETGHTVLPDFETGLPIRDREKALKVIEDSWETARTEGLNKIEPGKRGGYKLANAHSERRVFHYTSADAWIDAAEKYGYGVNSLYDSLMSHIREVSREYGLLRVLGPNPDSTARAVVDQAEKEGKRMLGGFVGTRHHLEAVFEHASGRAQSPQNEGMARWGRTVASFLRGAQLGSAMISAVGDSATTLKTADFLGLSKTKVIQRYLEFMNPSAVGARDQAIRQGLGAQHASATARQGFQDGLEFGVAATAAKFSDFLMQVSVLQPHTAAARHSIGSELPSHLTQLAKQRRAFDNMPGTILRFFERNGIDEADWAVMKEHGITNTVGVDWMSPDALAKAGKADTALRLLSGINREMDMAAPIGGAFERALLTGKSKPGGIAHEFLIRPWATYKMYPASIITHHGFRMAATFAQEGVGPGMMYASLALTMTALGALALQAKNIAQGKDPQSMGTANFWIHSFVQGGGAGVFGDFLWAGTNRGGQRFAETFLGPQIGLLADIVKLTGGNIGPLGAEKDTHFGRELANLARRYTPGTSLWYTRLSLDRLLWDSVQKELDPDYPAAFRRVEERARKEFSTEFWWSPGSSTPSRGPNLEAAIKTR